MLILKHYTKFQWVFYWLLMSETPSPKLPIFFILGRPRSGTTLLRILFDAHPNVIIPPEFPIIPILANKFRKTRTWHREQVQSFIDSIYNHPTFGHRTIDHLQIDREKLTSDLLNATSPNSLGDYFTQFNAHSNSLFPKSEIQLVGDKNPLYSIFTQFIMRIFPEAKFICLIRDYRDTYTSFTNMKGDPFEAPNLYLQISRWRYVVKQFMKYKKSHPDNFFLVRYEDLVSQPLLWVEKITGFLNIPFDPTVVNYHMYRDKIIETYTLENVQKYHKSLLYPINTGRIGIWKDKLTDKEVQTADQLAGKYADLTGYQREYRKFNLGIYLKSRPMAIYSNFLFKLLRISLRFPYSIRKWLSSRLKNLVGFYMAFQRKKTTHSGNKTDPSRSPQSS